MASPVRTRFLRQLFDIRSHRRFNQLARSLNLRAYSSERRSSGGSTTNTLLVVSGVALATTTLIAYKLNVFSPYGGRNEKTAKSEGSEAQAVSAESGAATTSDTPKTEVQTSEESQAGASTPAPAEKEKEISSPTPAENAVPTPIEIPASVPYLLIGGGTASFTAAKVILEKDPEAKILIVTEEDYAPYMRPPLSKELWFTDDLKETAESLRFKQWNGKVRSLFYKEDSFYVKPSDLNEKSGVAILERHKVQKICPAKQSVILSDGREISYGKLLVATGGKPKSLPIFTNAPAEIRSNITLFRNIDDFRHLVNVCETAKSVVIVGGGFLGSELACALGKLGGKSGPQVTQIFPESGNMGMIFPKYLSNWTTTQVRKEGVEVLTNNTISSVTSKDGRVLLKTSENKEILADHVVVAVGIGVENDLAAASGLEVDSTYGGYHVNAEFLAASNVWVAGDAACFYDFKLGCRRRVEHHDHAVVSGRLVGENMTGNHKRYEHQSMFWSDLGPKIGYEAIGIVDSSLETVAVWAGAAETDTPRAAAESSGTGIRSEVQDEVSGSSGGGESGSALPGQSELEEADELDFGKGVVFYMKNQKVVGVICWNVFNQIPVARRIIDEGKVYDDVQAVHQLGKAFKIYS